jgi:hypothetical protein
MRQFFLAYPAGTALPEAMGGSLKPPEKRSAVPSESVQASFPPHLGWTHYTTLMRVTNPTARAFYEIAAARESWSRGPFPAHRVSAGARKPRPVGRSHLNLAQAE